MKNFWLVVLVAALFGSAGYLWGRRSVEIVERITTRYDTVYFERPVPFRTSVRDVAAVRVPQLLFAPADTVRQTVYVTVTDPAGDSVALHVPIIEREYRDSTYRAQVSGPQVGEYGPALDWVEVYNRTTTREVEHRRRTRFAVTAGAGMAYTPEGFQPYIGVGMGLVLWGW